MECRVSSLDHYRHTLPVGPIRDRVTRAAAEGFLAIGRAFPGESPVYLLRSAAILVSSGSHMHFPRRRRDNLREEALLEANAGNFTVAAMLLDVLAASPTTIDEHTSLASDLEPMLATSGIGQGLDTVEESVLRRAIIVARAAYETSSDLVDLQLLLDWTIGLPMWNEAAEVVVAANGLAARGKTSMEKASALNEQLKSARITQGQRDRQVEGRPGTQRGSEATSAGSDTDGDAPETTPRQPSARGRRRSARG
jgi:hypothetical protein